MLYQLRIELKAKKQLERLPQKAQNRILSVLPKLQKNPFIGKKLSGKLKGAYSYYVWPYRIIYKIYKDKLLVIVIRFHHRQGAYK